jgi:membrane associated rhomboid family serine protease
MGWQDRDYARPTPPPGAGWHGGGFASSAGRSIVTTLIIINVAIFVLARFPAVERLLYGYNEPVAFGIRIVPGIAELRAELVWQGQVWRLLTAQYLHADIWHLFINMLVLHFLGRPLERMWPARKFFGVYTLCGLAGNVFFTALGALNVIESWMPAVGASGCIYGLLGIVAVLFPTATVYVYFLFPIKIRTAAYIFGGIAVLMILTRGQNFGGEACHLAGLVAGVWWAWKGDRWWATSRWRLPRWRPRVQRQKPKGFAAKVAERRADAETVDRILRKVYDGGIHSLSEAEKRALKEATERQQKREEEAGRIDRL